MATIKIGDREMTVDEARGLYDELRKVFGGYAPNSVPKPNSTYPEDWGRWPSVSPFWYGARPSWYWPYNSVKTT